MNTDQLDNLLDTLYNHPAVEVVENSNDGEIKRLYVFSIGKHTYRLHATRYPIPGAGWQIKMKMKQPED